MLRDFDTLSFTVHTSSQFAIMDSCIAVIANAVLFVFVEKCPRVRKCTRIGACTGSCKIKSVRNLRWLAFITYRGPQLLMNLQYFYMHFCFSNLTGL